MGRPIRVLSLSLALAFAAGGALAASGAMTIEINDSQRVGLYGAAANIIVSDPAVADVSLVDSRSVVINGRGFGATHVVVLDGNGRALFDRRVTVIAPQEGRVTLYRGPAASEFSCAPRCQVAAATAAGGSSTTPAAAPSPPTP
ncbi:MAG TPA: pilus assembly protein N-terminal domain-containing protein [Caulobacteraceae bacterium]|jgi:Flp pilus assembly secretin CpaC